MLKHILEPEEKKLYKYILYKYITSLLWEMYNGKLADIVNNYNNTYHGTIKMKPVNIQSCTYLDFTVEKMMKILKLKLGTM